MIAKISHQCMIQYYMTEEVIFYDKFLYYLKYKKKLIQIISHFGYIIINVFCSFIAVLDFLAATFQIILMKVRFFLLQN